MKIFLSAYLFLCLPAVWAAGSATPSGHTEVSIVGDGFFINGKPTYAGRTWNGHKIEGLLLNARLIQGIFDDRNSATLPRWAYPDTGKWDPDRNTREFVAAMPEWRRRGLLAFTINMQGGMPVGGANSQPWTNSAFEANGSLRAGYMSRLERILDRADELGMVVMVGYFYFGQDTRLTDEAAVGNATDNATHWLLDHGWRNVLVEVDNECDIVYTHPILKAPRVHELIQRVQGVTNAGRRLLVGTSYSGGAIPRENVVRVADFLLIHGNGISDPKKIADMVRRTRAVPGYTPKPVLFNEDDHYNFDQPENNFTAAVSEYASWGYYDQGTNNYTDGYQSPPVNWGINTDRKKAFFQLVSEISNEKPHENADVTFDFTMSADDVLSVYAQTAGEKLQVAANIRHGRMVRAKTPQPMTKTEALKFLEQALLEQAEFTIKRSTAGTLVVTTKDQLRGPPDFVGAIRIYLPDGTVDPPIPTPGGPPH